MFKFPPVRVNLTVLENLNQICMKKVFFLGMLLTIAAVARSQDQNRNENDQRNNEITESLKQDHLDLENEQAEFEDEQQDIKNDQLDLKDDHQYLLNDHLDLNDDHEDSIKDEKDFGHDQGDLLDDPKDAKNEQSNIDEKPSCDVFLSLLPLKNVNEST